MAAHAKLIIAFALGCATLAPNAAAQRGADAEAALTLAQLEPQGLEAGRCGLFLWSRGERPEFVFVAYDQPAAARVKISGRERDLPRTAFSGAVLTGHFEQQTYAQDGVTLDVQVRADETRTVRDGTIISDGVIRVIENNGWESVVPVGGMIACQR
ncbi:MAG: hypothetical protein GC206_07295 [Alphaproteobacteria bacterium]|nr:hypothetical protein [Alphaproteobacteria bacterium]